MGFSRTFQLQLLTVFTVMVVTAAAWLLAAPPARAADLSPVAPAPRQVQATSAITITVPEMETGELYESLMEATGQIFEPQIEIFQTIYPLYTTIVLQHNPVTAGTEALASIMVLWSYFSYFQNLMPGLVSLSAVVIFFLLVRTVKILASILMYVWKLIPLKFT